MADMKLRECPFCGRDDIEIDKSIPDTIHLTCICGADYVGFEVDRSIDEIIEDWNTRAADAIIEAQEAEIKRLRGMLEYAHEIFKAYADSSYSFNNCATVGEDAAGVIEAALKGE